VRNTTVIALLNHHGMPILIYLFLKLDQFGDRREAHVVKLIRKMSPSVGEVCSDNALLVFQSRTVLGTRRPSFFIVPTKSRSTSIIWVSAPIVMKRTLSSANCQESKVQGAVNVPVSQFSNRQTIKHHTQDTEFST